VTVFAINGTIIKESPGAVDRIEFYISPRNSRVRIYYQKWGAKTLPVSIGMEIPADIWLKIADVLDGHDPDFDVDVMVESDGPEFVFPSSKKGKSTPTVTPPEQIKPPKKKAAFKKKAAKKKSAPKLRIN